MALARVFAEVIRLKMKSFGWALIQYDWHSYKNGKFGDRCSHKENRHHVKFKDDVSTSQSNPKELEERHGQVFPQPSEEPALPRP